MSTISAGRTVSMGARTILAGALAAMVASGCGGQAVTTVPPSAPAVVLVSIDGFRPDYLERLPTPNLRRLAARGVRARWMAPVFPTKTFNNHYTLATGLYPTRHGMVSNRFVDPVHGAFRYTDSVLVGQGRWWGGEPLWVTAERQGIRSAAYFWPGTEAPVGGVRPSVWKAYDGRVSASAKVDSVLAWLVSANGAPARFITLYFADVDEWGHERGPNSPELAEAVARVDSAIGRLVDGIARLGMAGRVNVIVLSEHGMTETSEHRMVFLDDYLDPATVQIIELGPFISLRPRDGDADRVVRALASAPHVRVYRRDQTPERWRYRDNPRVSDVVGVADDGWLLNTRQAFATRRNRYNGGDHGYDNESPAMRALFMAVGPAFRRGAVVGPFGAIHVYELVCHVLGLRPAQNDGSLDSVRVMLR